MSGRAFAASALATCLSTWFGCGLSPWAPGTAGSLGAILVILPLLHSPAYQIGFAALALFPAAVWSAGFMARQSGRKDPQTVVIDEVIGQWITLAAAPRLNWLALGIGFVSFRIFDIWKPWPTRALENLPGGWGIVLDDCMAGVYAALVLFGCGWFNFY